MPAARFRTAAPARMIIGLLFGLLSGAGVTAAVKAQPPTPTICNGGDLPAQALMEPAPAEQPDLLVTGTCNVQPGKKYYYANVNIIDKGQLAFKEKTNSQTNFWAGSIIIENGGVMTAGTTATPFGANGGTLTIYLYGAASPSAFDSGGNPVPADKQGQGALCRSPIPDGTTAPCGIPQAVWNDNGVTQFEGCVGSSSPNRCLPGLPVATKDYFYQYGPLYGDAKMVASGADQGKIGYFGYKTLAVSFGGTLTLRGYKGASYDAATDADPTSSGVSWTRLAANLEPGAPSLTLATDPGDRWKAGDQIVVTTTDYLPGHSEQLKIAASYTGGTTIPVDPATPVRWKHIGVRFPLSERIAAAAGRMSLDPQLVKNGAETRAAVALLTRSIRIVSAGDAPDQKFDDMPATYYFGAHTVVRQGFAKYQVQGVEFAQLGQGGRLGHYPVHFHMARQTPADTYVKDSSVNESMTRWYVIHSTEGVTLARDVGWKSIGHGYYLEDGTETDNNFYSDIGIFARAAIANIQNPRRVPGILAYNKCNGTGAGGAVPNSCSCPANDAKCADTDRDYFPYYSDFNHPSVFWITNGWNDFVGNMAAGAGTCGACYWLVPAYNSGMADVGMMPMKWSGYAGLQKNLTFAGTTPLKAFYGNSCSSAMDSFVTVGSTAACSGFLAALDTGNPADSNLPAINAVQSIAPAPAKTLDAETYYPRAPSAGNRKATRCPAGTDGPDCSAVKPCASATATDPSPEANCAATMLDHYTSAFHWAPLATAALWLRPQWYLLDNSVLSDVQNAGLTFVTGGDYTRSSIIEGYWALARNTVFIGDTQSDNLFASNAGPFDNGSGLTCQKNKNGSGGGPYCLNADQGISMPLENFNVNQKLFNIYDGPSYEDSNIYLDITTTKVNALDCRAAGNTGTGPGCMYAHGSPGVREIRPDTSGAKCYLPNAAIGWKQPNGFFYPPAFHSTNLYFDNVDIRHYVIEPLFKAGTYQTDNAAMGGVYCNFGAQNQFLGFTDIDRQTELNDDDGSLTGLINDVKPTTGTISVNEDAYFNAPVATAECRSDAGVAPCFSTKNPPPPPTAQTSPYDYVTTAVIPDCSQSKSCADTWAAECENQNCYGIPLYRQFLTGVKGADATASTREWASWYQDKCVTDPTTPQCRWPFIRMAGAGIYQRSTLTANNATYYLDTAVSRATQQTEPLFDGGGTAAQWNIFQPNGKYYVFFVYAKQTTKQTYQVFVGKNRNPAPVAQGVRAHIDQTVGPGTPTFSADSWSGLTSQYDAASGVLQVTVDFSGVTELDPSPAERVAQGLCQPAKFCKPGGSGGCQCAFDKSDPLAQANPDPQQVVNECNTVCENWAMKDLDCPTKGCLGFSFALPAAFAYDPDNKLGNAPANRPQPKAFPAAAAPKHLPDWTTQFLNTLTAPDKGSPGACYYAALPGAASCPITSD